MRAAHHTHFKRPAKEAPVFFFVFRIFDGDVRAPKRALQYFAFVFGETTGMLFSDELCARKDIDELHIRFRQSPGLIRHDDGRGAEGFRRRKVAHHALALGEPLEAHGEDDGERDRECFGNRANGNRRRHEKHFENALAAREAEEED